MILVGEGYDRVKQETFYRPLGGGIEFGETGHDTIAREIKEEIGAEVGQTRYIGTVENLFTFEGRQGHEIVLVYEAKLNDSTVFKMDVIDGLEKFPEGVLPIKVVWKPINSFRSGELRLYPDKLLELLDST